MYKAMFVCVCARVCMRACVCVLRLRMYYNIIASSHIYSSWTWAVPRLCYLQDELVQLVQWILIHSFLIWIWTTSNIALLILCNFYWYIVHITSFFIMYICIYNNILVSKSCRCIAMGETSPATHTPRHWTFMSKWEVDIRYQTDDGDRQELLQLWDKSGRP